MVCILSPLLPVSLSDMGLTHDCGLTSRLCYSFFHASIFHLIGNCWVLLCVVFYYEVPLSRLIISYLVAISAPSFSVMPTIGLSAVVYCLLGQVSYSVKRKVYYQFWVIISLILFGFVLPDMMDRCGAQIAHPDNYLHIYCYVVGLLVGFFNSPVSLWRRRR